MRRFWIAISLMFLLLSASLPVSGTESGFFQTAGELWTYWSENQCVPDYITGIWSTDGGPTNLTFGIVAGEEGENAKQLLLSRIEDDSTVTFVTQTYPRNYLWAIMEDVNTYFDRGLGFMSAGPDEYDNIVYVEVHTDYENNPKSLAAVAELKEKYGGAISISFTDNTYVAVMDDAIPPSLMLPPLTPKEPASPLPVLLGICVVLMWLLVLLHRKQRLLAVSGGTAEITCGNMEALIKKSVPSVPETLDARIFDSIAKADP